MYSSRGSNAYGQQPYGGQSAYGQNVSFFRYFALIRVNNCKFILSIRISICFVFCYVAFLVWVFLKLFNVNLFWYFKECTNSHFFLKIFGFGYFTCQ